MGTGRTMGPGWIRVEPEGIVSDGQLTFWITVAMEHNAEQARSRH